MEEELKQVHALVRENHEMLRAIRRDAWFHTIVHLVFWLAIVASSWYAYQKYLVPYLGSVPTAAQFQQMLSQYRLK